MLAIEDWVTFLQQAVFLLCMFSKIQFLFYVLSQCTIVHSIIRPAPIILLIVFLCRNLGLSYDAQIQPQLAHTDNDITYGLPDDIIPPKVGNSLLMMMSHPGSLWPCQARPVNRPYSQIHGSTEELNLRPMGTYDSTQPTKLTCQCASFLI